MASLLRQIYAKLAERSMSISTGTIPCRTLATTNGVIDKTPVRVLSPLSERAEGKGLTPITFGGAKTLQWMITELCLLAPVASASGLEFYTPLLVEYQEAFVNSYPTRHLGLGDQVIVNTVDLEMGEYNYPLGSANWYYGVKATWTIRENLE